MALDFPASPTNGQVYSNGGVAWFWDTAKWVSQGSGGPYLPLTGGTVTGLTNFTNNIGVQGRAALKQIDVGDSEAVRVGYFDGLTGNIGAQGALSLYKLSPARNWVINNDTNSLTFTLDGNLKFWFDPTSNGLSTMSNDFVMLPTTGAVNIYLRNSGGNNANNIFGQRGSAARWAIQVGDGSNEIGGNSGNNFQIYRYNDAGTIIDSVMNINRANGAAGFRSLNVIGPGQGILSYTSAAGGGASSIVSRVDNTGCYLVYFQYGAGGHPGDITTTGSAVGYNSASDARLKENIVPIGVEYAASVIDALEPVEFDWLTGEKPHAYGFLAQDVHSVFPDAVTVGSEVGPEDENFRSWSMDNAKLIPVMMTEIKALRARVAALEGAA